MKKISKKNIIIIAAVLFFIIAAVLFFILREDKSEVIINKNITPEKRAELEARKDLQLEYIKEYPDYYEAYMDLGNIEQELSNYKQALKYYEKAWEIIPANSTPLLNKASVYIEMGELKKAYKEFWRAQRANPNYYLVYQKIVDFYQWHYKEKQSEIDDVFILGLDLTTNDRDLMRSYAAYLFDNNRVADSLPYYERLIQSNPSDQFLINRITEIRQRMGIE